MSYPPPPKEEEKTNHEHWIPHRFTFGLIVVGRGVALWWHHVRRSLWFDQTSSTTTNFNTRMCLAWKMGCYLGAPKVELGYWPHLTKSPKLSNHHHHILVFPYPFVIFFCLAPMKVLVCSSNKDIFRVEETCGMATITIHLDATDGYIIAYHSMPSLIVVGIKLARASRPITPPNFGGRSNKSGPTHDPLVELREWESPWMDEKLYPPDVQSIHGYRVYFKGHLWKFEAVIGEIFGHNHRLRS